MEVILSGVTLSFEKRLSHLMRSDTTTHVGHSFNVYDKFSKFHQGGSYIAVCDKVKISAITRFRSIRTGKMIINTAQRVNGVRGRLGTAYLTCKPGNK